MPGNLKILLIFVHFFPLMRKSRNGETLTDAEKKQLDEMREAMDAYNKEVANWRSSVTMDKFKGVKKCITMPGSPFMPSNRMHLVRTIPMLRSIMVSGLQKHWALPTYTLELPGDDAHTRKLGEMAAKHKIYVGYHGHEQQTPTIWDTALAQSKYNALNLDLGHYVAAGNPDPLDLIMAKHDRIASMHIKDRQKPENGKGNLPWGQGDTPLTETLNLMSTENINFPLPLNLNMRYLPDLIR
jgi:hypothetical protein